MGKAAIVRPFSFVLTAPQGITSVITTNGVFLEVIDRTHVPFVAVQVRTAEDISIFLSHNAISERTAAKLAVLWLAREINLRPTLKRLHDLEERLFPLRLESELCASTIVQMSIKTELALKLCTSYPPFTPSLAATLECLADEIISRPSLNEPDTEPITSTCQPISLPSLTATLTPRQR